MSSYQKELLIICLGLIAVTAVFYFFELDVALQRYFYSQADGWFMAKETPWQQIRDYSNLPALLLAIFSLVGIILGYNFRRYAPYRKIFVFFVILMVIGPGLIVNLVLKDNFGRPRPRHIVEFNGKYQHEKPLAYDPTSPGKSFPCGHASMGFYFFGVYILFRRKLRLLSILGMLVGLFWGGLIGLTRMIQGGHFLSDVIYSGVILYLCALVIFRLLKFSPDLRIKVEEISSQKKRVVTGLLSILILLLTAAVLLATPRDKKHTVRFDNYTIRNSRKLHLNLELVEGELSLIPADSLLYQNRFEGFGFPKSNLRHKFTAAKQDSIYYIDFIQYVKGYFTELKHEITLYLPRDKDILITGKIGDVTLDKRLYYPPLEE